MASADAEPDIVTIDNCTHGGPDGFRADWQLVSGPADDAPEFVWRVKLTCGLCGGVFAPDPIRGVRFDHETGSWILHAQPLPASAVVPTPPPIH